MQCHDETTWYTGIIILKGILHKECATSTLRLKTGTANITPCIIIMTINKQYQTYPPPGQNQLQF